MKRCWSSFGQSPIQCRFWPCIASLVLAIVLLQLLHIALLSHLENRENLRNLQLDSSPLLSRRAVLAAAASVGRQLQGRTLDTVLAEMEERVRGAHRLDKSGTYLLLDNFLPSELTIRGQGPFDVSLVTQCTSSKLSNIWDLTASWEGPVSVAIFTWDDDFLMAASRLLYIHFCNEHVLRNVSFHLVYPISRSPRHQHLAALSRLKLDCPSTSAGRDLDPIFIDQSFENYANRGKELAYPNNLLRNFAINYVQTPYVFVTDADMIPSEGLRTKFQRFMSSFSLVPPSLSKSPSLFLAKDTNEAKRNMLIEKLTHGKDNLLAFVVPAFELDTSARVPSKKSELLEFWDKGQVRPFYWDVCSRCQEDTNYDRWRTLVSSDIGHEHDSQSTSEVAIGYTVDYKDPWEPFYIASKSLPLYDERFKQYGFNRISQVCEMHIAGFTFHVLDNAFLVHMGFKKQNSFHSDKDAENDRNRLLFRKYKEELKVKYPNVTRSLLPDSAIFRQVEDLRSAFTKNFRSYRFIACALKLSPLAEASCASFSSTSLEQAFMRTAL
ncbi:N-acetyllactosaminide beta-1,3-n-acetylglucosaminyltransferase [Plakobranchus ocellatus]|uniref:Beta-1,4-glucuronyltransferase 1 n=1 Tax=Plakobranchus ocellatus TaxID=259542 RepID=A0AAV4C7R9_9GAST|nr:N-acetyllactosaminide beta-1,3-n-acetylglucosaminyltransferase [Plakobranchus ocellatus]